MNIFAENNTILGSVEVPDFGEIFAETKNLPFLPLDCLGTKCSFGVKNPYWFPTQDNLFIKEYDRSENFYLFITKLYRGAVTSSRRFELNKQLNIIRKIVAKDKRTEKDKEELATYVQNAKAFLDNFKHSMSTEIDTVLNEKELYIVKDFFKLYYGGYTASITVNTRLLKNFFGDNGNEQRTFIKGARAFVCKRGMLFERDDNGTYPLVMVGLGSHDYIGNALNSVLENEPDYNFISVYFDYTFYTDKTYLSLRNSILKKLRNSFPGYETVLIDGKKFANQYFKSIIFNNPRSTAEKMKLYQEISQEIYKKLSIPSDAVSFIGTAAKIKEEILKMRADYSEKEEEKKPIELEDVAISEEELMAFLTVSRDVENDMVLEDHPDTPQPDEGISFVRVSDLPTMSITLPGSDGSYFVYRHDSNTPAIHVPIVSDVRERLEGMGVPDNIIEAAITRGLALGYLPAENMDYRVEQHGDNITLPQTPVTEEQIRQAVREVFAGYFSGTGEGMIEQIINSQNEEGPN